MGINSRIRVGLYALVAAVVIGLESPRAYGARGHDERVPDEHEGEDEREELPPQLFPAERRAPPDFQTQSRRHAVTVSAGGSCAVTDSRTRSISAPTARSFASIFS